MHRDRVRMRGEFELPAEPDDEPDDADDDDEEDAALHADLGDFRLSGEGPLPITA